MTEPAPDATSSEPPRDRSLWLIAGVALALRVAEAIESSLWLDELHTLSHASQPTLSAVLESVRGEFHTPLFFAFVHLFGGFEAGAWLRAIPILSSVALLWPLAAVARECGLGARAVSWTAWLYACLPYQVLYGSELRPYAWIGAFSLLAFFFAFSERRSTPLRLCAFFFCILLGLLTHRLMALGLLSLGCARLFAKRERAVPLLGLIAAGTLAVAGFLPWLVGFAKQATDLRFDYQASVGGYHLRSTLVWELVALPSRIVMPFLRELGGAWGVLALACAVVFAASACALAVCAWRGRASRAPAPVLRGLAIFAAVQFVITTAFAVYTWDRVPLQYYTPMAWTIPVLLAACVDRAPQRRALALVVGACCLALGVALAGGRSREDMRGGIAAVRELGTAARAASGAEPIYSALLAQPRHFEHRLPYRAYAPDLAAVEPDLVPRPGDPRFQRPLILLSRNIGKKDEAMLALTNGRTLKAEKKIDRYLTASWYEPAPADRK